MKVVQSADSDNGALFIAAVDRVRLVEEGEPEHVAFDCEGFNLSRLGTVELVSICFKLEGVFLVDLGGTPDSLTPDSDILRAVKELFEDENVAKIIHDSRMDSDALFHLHGIKLKNVHDTSCYHTVITGYEDKNLNDMLMYNGISQNAVRDKGVYKQNPAFWRTRPLTKQMIDWASSDVDKLFDVADKQLKNLSESWRERAIDKSQTNASSARDMHVESGLRVRNPGLFIGRGGSNIRKLQKRTGTLIYQQRPSDGWFVYYQNIDALDKVKRQMNC